ncbi:unnamed protein product, partial [Rotaria magnacalcarata]
EKAKRVIGQKGYDLICCNCEHFATECRYGVPISRQVDIIGVLLFSIVLLNGTKLISSISKTGASQK